VGANDLKKTAIFDVVKFSIKQGSIMVNHDFDG